MNNPIQGPCPVCGVGPGMPCRVVVNDSLVMGNVWHSARSEGLPSTSWLAPEKHEDWRADMAGLIMDLEASRRESQSLRNALRELKPTIDRALAFHPKDRIPRIGDKP